METDMDLILLDAIIKYFISLPSMEGRHSAQKPALNILLILSVAWSQFEWKPKIEVFIHFVCSLMRGRGLSVTVL